MEVINRDEYTQFRTEVELFVKQARTVFEEFSIVLRERAAEAVMMQQMQADIKDHNDRIKKVEGRVAQLFFGGAAIVAALELAIRVIPMMQGN